MKLVKGKLMKGMLLASMATVAGAAAAVGKAADAANAGAQAAEAMPATGGAPVDTMSGNDEWACKVALCMTSPGGPTQFGECVEPIRRLQRHLAKGKPFPVCPFVGGGEGQQGAAGAGGPEQSQRDPLQVQ